MEVHTKSTDLRGSGRIHKELTYWTGKQLVVPTTQETSKLDRRDVLATGVVVPSQYNGDKRLNWARNPESLAFAIEHGKLKDGESIGWIHQGTLPKNFTHAQMHKATRALAKELSDELGVAAVYAVHDRKVGRANTRHFHIFTTARQVGPDGVGAKADTQLGAERLEAKLGGTVATYVHRKWEEKLVAAYKSAGMRVPHSIGSGEALASTEGLLQPREYPGEIVKQAGALARVARDFAGVYRESATRADQTRVDDSKPGRPLKGPLSSGDREVLGKRIAGVFHNIERLEQTLVDASKAGGFSLTAEKRRYAPMAAKERAEQSRLTPQEQAREDRRMNKMDDTGNRKRVMTLAVKEWQERVGSGRSVSIPKIMNHAMDQVAQPNKAKGGSHGR